MNLEGSLDAFGLPDVVALLAGTGKTGGLLLRRKDGAERAGTQGVVWFRDGQVSGASSDRGRASLVRRVVGSGAVDDAALRQAVSRATAGHGGVARSLMDAGTVDPDLLRQAAEDQAVDAVFDLLRWPDGEFAFDPALRDADDVGLLLGHEQVLKEARARIDAWGALVVVIPGADAVLTIPTVLGQDPEVTRDEWALLSLVDGHRSVRDLVELTGAGEFAVTTLLARLVQRGLLQVKDPSAPDHVSVVERRLAMLSAVEDLGEVPGDPDAEAAALTRHAPPPAPAHDGHGLSAAAALAAARAAQGLPAAGTRHDSGERPARDHEDQPVAGASASGGTAPYGTPSAPAQPHSTGFGTAGTVDGATARTLTHQGPLPAPDPRHDAVIERDPAVNRSLLLRLIAGVRGL